MLRKNKECKRRNGWYYNTKFSDKIAIMYGGIFSILVFVVCLALTVSTSINYVSMRQAELAKAADDVEAAVAANGFLEKDDIEELNLGKNVHIGIIDITEVTRGIEMDVVAPLSGSTIRIESGHSNMNFKQNMAFQYRYMNLVRSVNHLDKTFLIIVEYPREAESKAIRALSLMFLVILFLGLTGASLTGRYISRKMLKPIIDMTNTAASLGVEDLSRRIEYRGPDDEIKVLADTFNEMIDRLEIAFNRQTRFISDASHELRTPISVIQGYANLIDRWGKEDPDILSEAISSIKDETESMSSLIKSMLNLAQYQQKSYAIMESGKVRLNEVVKEIIRENDIMEESLTLVYKEMGELSVKGDYELIKQLLRIFIDNANKYTIDRDEAVIISVFENEEGFACISVEDSGIGIDEEDLPHIFARFYRADKSRNKEIPGNGIGLSIAEIIVKQHKAKILVESEKGKGSIFTIVFSGEKPENSDETNS